MSSSVQERLKLKRITLDTWSTKEKLSLASSVLRSGDQNWSCVSRNIRMFAEPNRPPDWFSQKNCAQQYASLLENVETPKRKKRTAGSTEKTEVETPGESIVRKLSTERIDELKKTMLETQAEYLKLKEEINGLISGECDEKLALFVQQLEDDKKQKEQEKEAHIKWLKEREERKIELERAWKPSMHLANLRRASSMSEPSSEADSPLSEPLNVDVPEEAVLTKATPTSPLLSSLLKSPSTAAQTTSSILHSAITSPHRGSSPTIASLLSSSPGLPGNLVMPPSNVSPNLKNLVSNAIGASYGDEHKTVPQSPSQEHLGPPPPYSQATEYLQKQRAEQLIQQVQAAQMQVTPPPPIVKPKIEEPKVVPSPAEPIISPIVTPTSTTHPQPLAGRRGSLKARRLDLGESETEESKPEPPKPSPVKEKEHKRVLHNTSDHDYMESPIKEKEKMETATPKKAETDVFEFDEQKEGYDKFDLMIKDSKMSYLKSSNAQKKKDTEPKSYLRENQPLHEPKIIVTGENYEDIPLKDLAKKETEEAKKERVGSLSPNVEGKRSARNSSEGKQEEVEPLAKRARSLSVEDIVKKEKRKSTDTPAEQPVNVTAEKSPVKEEELTNDESTMEDSETEKKKSEVSEEQSEVEEPEDSESAKEEDTLSHVTDTLKSEKADLSTTEDEKSNDATPKVYSRRRGTTSLSDSVPNSPVPFTEEDKEYKTWKKSVMLVYTRLAGHKYSSIFLKPITDEHAPGYSTIVFRPMDLSTIKRNIELGHTRITSEFQRDVMLMFVNALMYNKTDHHVFNMAREMQLDSIEHFQMMHQATGGDSTSLRRETRTQQNLSEVKKALEKSGRQSKVASEADKQGGVAETKGRSSRGSSLRGSPSLVDRSRRKTPPPPSKRKRPVSGSDGNRKRQKVDE